MITVKIDEDTAISMLMERLQYWKPDTVTESLYEKMYTNYVEGGCFDGAEFNPMMIVDNDWVNYCDVVSEGHEYYDAVKKHFDSEGLGDCSCDHDCGFSYIEAEEDGTFLCRW